MRLEEFDYQLPKELIAQYPLKDRKRARLMVLDRKEAKICDRVFEDIVEYFDEGDLLVLNDTKVIPARLFGKRKTGGRVELFLLVPLEKNSLTGLEKKNPASEALLRPSKRLKKGERIILESGDEAEILDKGKIGTLLRFSRSLDEILDVCGHIPLPPYIKRVDEESDKEDYQTIYAKNAGATASPTAGLHFTKGLLEQIKNKGIKVSYITLHTSYGTFAPVRTEIVENHKIHGEYFNISEETIKTIQDTKRNGGKIFAVGTTTARALEHYFKTHDARRTTHDASGYTNLYIYPSYKFRAVDCLITNFHLPKSTLMLLVCAFAGRDFIFKAYAYAIKEKYRFYSYGDATLII